MVVVLFEHGIACESRTVTCKTTAAADTGDVCILLESTLLFFSSICHLFFSLCHPPICVSLSMYILLDLKDVTDFEGQSYAFRPDIDSAGYISEDIALHIPAHLTNTQMFLDRLRNARPKSAYVMESFDVTALYTNVSNDSAMQAIRELLEKHEGAINIWSGKYYAQIRGLAMGQRLAPTLAVAFMSKVEAPVIDLTPLLYCREFRKSDRNTTGHSKTPASSQPPVRPSMYNKKLHNLPKW
ncbi:unnamed protein product [Angiostrongylus costaricensis]|uniref:Reverse transcriptase domain-containing protein n=1 Tax=Angiostrongylus costaricensis TaxID=334426 RepID=A0A0R3Q211_ANGCS|nr:unnamed protein product [Angiostrongylus costaricensis]